MAQSRTDKLRAGPLEKGISEVTLAHVYRAEVARSTTWRTRLDITTNWAVTIAAAIVSFSFTNSAAPHATLLVGVVVMFTFLAIEARRYRYYDLWARRVRLMETSYFTPLLRREPVSVDFYAALSSEFSRPRLRITALDSLAFRLQRTYTPIFVILLAGWVVKLDMHPTEAESFRVLIDRASIGPVPGSIVWVAWALGSLFLATLYFYAGRAPLPTTELRAPIKRRSPLAEAFQNVGGKGEIRMRQRIPEVREATSEENRLA